MNIGNVRNINYNDYKNLSDFYKPSSKDKIKREPTEEQLSSIEESQRREAEYLKDNSLIVPIDWEHVKETINLREEELKLREKQYRDELEQAYNEMHDYNEKFYRTRMNDIDRNAEINEKKENERTEGKARVIIATFERKSIVLLLIWN